MFDYKLSAFQLFKHFNINPTTIHRTTLMKRIILIILITLFLFSCGTNLKNAYKLSPGMTKNEVIAILGAPAVNDFDRNVEEWHYCNYMGNFIALYFVDGKLIAKTSYSVSEDDR